MKKKILSAVLSASMAVTAVSGLTITANAEVTGGKLSVGDTVKFDFGADGQTAASGYYSVTPSTEFNSTFAADGLQYGLYGNNTNDYKLNEYVDGVRMIQGQVTNYQAASAPGSGADSDSVGPVEVTNGENGQINGLYPIRFSMRDENNGYYEVKVTVTGLDSTKSATATVYSERRHPIVTDDTIEAGQSKTYEFSATTQNVVVKNRSTGGADTYKDDTVNIMAVGDNVAISSIEITKVNHKTTIWCYDDSTGCDYATRMPFFPYQNYGGTAQFLSKYLSADIVLCNQGDGGIAANDDAHWKAAYNNIQAGDYIYMQYGHNHKKDGASGYVTHLAKYYKKAHEVGAKMIYVGPIDRHNATQYTASTNTWKSTLNSFSKAAKCYTELLICGGLDLAETFVSKVKSAGAITDDIYAWADGEISKGITSAGVTDVAFVDLNAPTLAWLANVCETVKTTRGDDAYKYSNTNYYFQAVKGSSVDGTHPNDLGADCTAKMFFDGAAEIVNKETKTGIESVEAKVLSPLLVGERTATPYSVSKEMIMAGNAVNSLYPEVFKSSNAAAYPTAVKNVSWNEDGTIASVSILKQESTLTMSAYGILELIIKDKDENVKGTITSTQVDNTWTDGSTTAFSKDDDTNKLSGDLNAVYSKSAGDTFTAIIWQATDNGDGLNKTEPNVQYSEVYVPTELESVLITDEDGNAGEDFDFYGVLYNGTGNLKGKNGWAVVGSAGAKTSLGSDAGTYYSNVASDSGGSFMAYKKLAAKITASGRVKFSMTLKPYDGVTDPIVLGIGTVTNHNWPDSSVALLRVNKTDVSVTDGSSTKSIGTLSDSAWTTVSGTLDFDRGTLTVKFGDSDEVETTIPNYSTAAATVSPASFTDFYAQGTSNKASGVKISALSVDKYSSDDGLASYITTVASVNNEYGTVSISGTDAKEISAKQGATVTVKAVPSGTMSFVNWTDGEGNIVSDSAEYSFRVMGNLALKANFGYYGTINAIDENNNVLKELGKVPGAPGEEYKITALPAVIEKDGVLYELDSSEDTSYSRTFTMGNEGDEVKTVTYKANSNLIYFCEAENGKNYASSNGASVTDEKYSGGKGYKVDKSDYSMGFEGIAFASDGEYDIIIGYGARGADRSGDVYLVNANNTETKIGTISAKKDKDGICTINTNITAGKYNIKLKSTSGNSPVYDYIKIIAKKTGMLSSYSINAVDDSGDIIKILDSGAAFAGDEIALYVSEYIKGDDGKYYKRNETGSYKKELTVGENATKLNVNYELAENVVYFYDGGTGEDGTYSGGGATYVGAQNARDRGISVGTLKAGKYTFKAYVTAANGRAVVLRSGKNDPFASISTQKGKTTAGEYHMEFTLAEDTENILFNGANSSDKSKTNQSENYDYFVIEKVVESEPTLQDVVDEAGTGTVTITADNAVSGTANVDADTTVAIENNALKDSTLTAKSGSITVKVGDSTITNVSSITFDSNGKVSQANAGAEFTTGNGETVDKGFVKTAEINNSDTIKVTVESGGKSGQIDAKLNTVVDGNAVVGIFIYGIPTDTELTVTSVE